MLKKKKLLIYIIIIATLSILLIYALNNTRSSKEIGDLKKELFSSAESELVDINKYIVYGAHLNIFGKLDVNLENININEVKLVLRDIDGREIQFDVDYKFDENNIRFGTSGLINEGINLDELDTGNYYIFIKIIHTQDDKQIDNYYLLCNNTEYESAEYYTTTRNNTNNKININSSEYLLDGIIVPYMSIDVKEEKLPDDIYDIVIDPGHGGNDCGAVKGSYEESLIALDYSIALRDKLEDLGLKVKMTRESDEYVEEYGEEGRAVIPNKVKAKYVFSIHLNSSAYTLKTGGVEIYSPTNSNLYFPKLIADNIVSMANTTYSSNNIHKVDEGVYVRSFTEGEIAEAQEYARSLNYLQYNITTSTPYLFMIRETGGIATNAYIDGRNKEYGINKYYNSNIGVEGYLIELGFMTCADDLNNMLNNKDSYVEAISTSVKEYLNLIN